MRKRIAGLLALSLLCAMSFNVSAQKAVVNKAEKFFPTKDLMPVGVYYYPEAWPENQWERDIKHIADMGFEFIHMGEFAWSFMEPEEGKYDFRWLDKCVELSAKYKLKVMLCTPSPCPPAWLSKKYPEILIKDQFGFTMEHGSRTHGSFSSLKFRELVRGIVTQLAQRYGKDKRVWGWQLDNEPSHYGKDDHGNAANIAFRIWLKNKYKTIEELNKQWGNEFWSQRYNNFDQIITINVRNQVHGTNPHAILDYNRFAAEECRDFLTDQYQTLRKTVDANQFVTTNFMSTYQWTDPNLSADLDLVSYTMYPVNGNNPQLGPESFRIGDPLSIGWASDHFRNITGKTGVMELQPGQVNWGTSNPQLYPGAVRMWLYDAFAGGASFACSYRFRQPLVGSEQYHYGMVNTDGLTETPGGKDYSSVCKDMLMLRKAYDPKAVMPQVLAAKRTALLWNRDNWYEQTYQKQTSNWSYLGNNYKYWRASKQLMAPVDIMTDKDNWQNHPIVIAPAYQLLDKELVAKWKAYVEKGGHLVLTCRTGQKDRNAHLWEEAWAGPILDLIGAKILFYDHVVEGIKGKVSFADKSFEWNSWADVLEPNKGTEVWATYADMFYSGKAAITHRKLGKGTVTYVGTEDNNSRHNLELDVLKKLYSMIGLNNDTIPKNVKIQWRDGFFVAVNYSSVPAQIQIPANAKILVGSKDLPACGVAVWQEK